MKTFKELKSKLDGIMEYNTLSQTAAWQVVNGTGAHVVEDPARLAEVNMFIARNLNRRFSDPVSAINMLRSKLNFIGIDFEANPQELATEGTVSFPVTRHGGSFGTTPDHDLRNGFYRDNGIRGLEMAITGDIVLEATGYRISLKIIPTEGTGIQPENPDPAES